TVTAFYLSNVEQYLFPVDRPLSEAFIARFYESVATLPLDSTSTFIRSVPRPSASGGIRVMNNGSLVFNMRGGAPVLTDSAGRPPAGLFELFAGPPGILDALDQGVSPIR